MFHFEGLLPFFFALELSHEEQVEIAIATAKKLGYKLNHKGKQGDMIVLQFEYINR